MQRCCCCSLRTGCFVIAIWWMVAAILTLCYYIKLLVSYHAYWEWITVVVLSAVVLLSAIFLLQGVQKRRPGWMTFWLVIAAIRGVCGVGLIIIYILELSRVMDMDTDTTTKIVQIVVEILEILLLIYCMAAVRSYQNQLRDDNLSHPTVGYHAPDAYVGGQEKV